MDEKQREEIAVFRYGVVTELVAGPLAPGEKEKILNRQAARRWTIPYSDRGTIGRTTIRDWAAAYEAMGFPGLKPRHRKDAGAARALPDDVQDLLLAMKRERPRASVTSIIRAVRLSGRVSADQTLASSTVDRLFRAHGLSGKGLPQPSAEPDARAFTHPHAGDLWTSDVMHGPRLLAPGRGRGGKTYLIALLDDATRVVPFAAFYPSESTACFMDCLRQGMLRRSVPRKLYVDNGSAYRSRHLQVLCATLCVALIHSRPYKPRGRGKIERFFRRVRQAFLPHVTEAMLKDLPSLNRVFWAWLEAEYHQTPHGGLDGRTPIDRFLDDEKLLRPAPDDLEALMRMRVTRKVGRDRTLRIDGRVYEAPDGYAGESVEVRYDPYDPARPVHMCRRGETEEIPLHRLDLAVNAVLPRPKVEPKDAEPAPATGVDYLELVAQGFYGEAK
ncbi:DDE-type integrase/transposase/recombinase [bacterium]|nr:DDE-type integrase/transposase/recombinase [bacterium]